MYEHYFNSANAIFCFAVKNKKSTAICYEMRESAKRQFTACLRAFVFLRLCALVASSCFEILAV